MAGRLPKVSIDYAGWSVSLFDNEPKMDKLLDAQGWDGFGVYFFLCQRAYGSDGYFYKWCYDDCATTARKMGGGIGAGTVKEAVDYCLQIGLFDKGLFDRWGVLTSRGIQKRYIEAIKKRDAKRVVAEYWLLHKEEECEGLLKLPLNSDLLKGNTDFSDGNNNFKTGNSNFRTQKKSKVKNSKKDNNSCPPEGERESEAGEEEKLKSDFEKIYAIYPKKIGRTVAFANYKLWLKGKTIGSKKYRLTNKQMYLAVRKYVRQQEDVGKDDYQYWKNFDTLMGRQLLDYVDDIT